MNHPEHHLQLVLGPTPQAIEQVHLVTTRLHRAAPVFRAPTLPTVPQMSRELPFTENLRSRVPLR